MRPTPYNTVNSTAAQNEDKGTLMFELSVVEKQTQELHECIEMLQQKISPLLSAFQEPTPNVRDDQPRPAFPDAINKLYNVSTTLAALINRVEQITKAARI